MATHKRIYPTGWKGLVALVKQRAGGQCECTGECGLHRTNPGPRRCTEMQGKAAKWAKGKIILTTAHLCQHSECADVTHMKHMCQRCHLRYDTKQHAINSARTRREKKAIADLFERDPESSIIRVDVHRMFEQDPEDDKLDFILT